VTFVIAHSKSDRGRTRSSIRNPVSLIGDVIIAFRLGALVITNCIKWSELIAVDVGLQTENLNLDLVIEIT
jgi:hypothetical protein